MGLRIGGARQNWQPADMQAGKQACRQACRQAGSAHIQAAARSQLNGITQGHHSWQSLALVRSDHTPTPTLHPRHPLRRLHLHVSAGGLRQGQHPAGRRRRGAALPRAQGVRPAGGSLTRGGARGGKEQEWRGSAGRDGGERGGAGDERGRLPFDAGGSSARGGGYRGARGAGRRESRKGGKAGWERGGGEGELGKRSIERGKGAV